MRPGVDHERRGRDYLGPFGASSAQSSISSETLDSHGSCISPDAAGPLSLFGITGHHFQHTFSTLSAHPEHLIRGLSQPHSFCRRGRRESAPSASGTTAASYSRYSSDLQDVSSIEQQKRKCREAAQSNGHDLRPEFEFKDEAVSGTRIDRDGLQSMLVAARERRFNILYFDSLSRLARENAISLPMLKELVHTCQVRVISVTEGIDSDRAGWEFMATVHGWMHAE